MTKAGVISFTGDECDLCAIYALAQKWVKLECPHCHKEIPHKDWSELEGTYHSTLLEFNSIEDHIRVVGEKDDSDTNQKFQAGIFHECPFCHGAILFVPTPLGYNANHDVYYTGVKKYLIPGGEEFKLAAEKAMEPILLRFLQEAETTGSLRAKTLLYALAQSMESLVAEFLAKK